MSGLNQFAAYLFSSGDAFFVGAVLIALGRATTWHFRRHRAAKWLSAKGGLTITGLIFLVLSMTPKTPVAIAQRRFMRGGAVEGSCCWRACRNFVMPNMKYMKDKAKFITAKPFITVRPPYPPPKMVTRAVRANK